MVGLFILFYVPKLIFSVFQILNDAARVLGFVITRIADKNTTLASAGLTMTRLEFITKIGILAAAVPFFSILHGITRGRFKYKVNNIRLSFRNLPDKFDKYRIVHISDWHIGSLYGHERQVEESIDIINRQKPDLILFSGDLVNNIADEVEPFIHILSKMKAVDGVYSILGNHDYGEYVNWESEEKHGKNMQKLFDYQSQSGFHLLKNDSIIINKEDQQIGLAGVENWGLPPFSQFGDLNKTLEKISHLPFKILMSHDPSHWDAEIRPKTDVDLTLSGHTHGMQFGIDIPGIKWSPVQWKYPRWSGLYSEDNQHLYVNVGIGYIGFPGRVGIYPEISVIELNKES